MELSIAVTLTGQLEFGRMYFRHPAPVSLGMSHIQQQAASFTIERKKLASANLYDTLYFKISTLLHFHSPFTWTTSESVAISLHTWRTPGHTR